MPAEQNAYFDGGVSIFKIHDGSQLQNISPYVKELRGLPGQFKVNDGTNWGAVGERPAPSIFVVHFTMEVSFNMVTSVGVNTVLGAMHAGKHLRAFEFYPAGEASGNAKWYGNIYLPIYEIASRWGSEITMHCEFHADNGITQGTA